jgi:hypothetical protein
MTGQQFEIYPNEERVRIMADLLRYENLSLLKRINALEKKQEELLGKLEEKGEELNKLQSVIDIQNADWFSNKNMP